MQSPNATANVTTNPIANFLILHPHQSCERLLARIEKRHTLKTAAQQISRTHARPFLAAALRVLRGRVETGDRRPQQVVAAVAGDAATNVGAGIIIARRILGDDRVLQRESAAAIRPDVSGNSCVA